MRARKGQTISRATVIAEYNFISKPLSKLNRATIQDYAREFHLKAKLDGVVDIETLQRGAWLTRNSGMLLEHPQTLKEKPELKSEEAGELSSLTKASRVLFFTCAIGAIVQGWSQESIVGANLNWGDELIPSFENSIGARYFALVNAMPYFAASVLGAWVSDPITYVYGRRTALFFAAVCSFAAPIGSAYCQTWYQLLVCRLIQGVGMGAKASVVPVIESEVAPPKLRGRLLVSWQTFVAVGIFFGALANLIFEGNWRWQIGIAFVPAVPLLCLCYVIPESPRWLMRKRQYSKAYLAFLELRATPLQATRDLFSVYIQSHVETLLFSGDDVNITTLTRSLKEDTKHDTKSGSAELYSRVSEFFVNILGLFSNRRNRHAVLASGVVMIAQQFSGINVFAFLVTTVIDNAKPTQPTATATSTATPTPTTSAGAHETVKPGSTQKLALALGFAASNAVFSPVAYFLIDHIERRALMLASLISMLPLLPLTGYFLDKRSTSISTALILIYTALYSPGAGVIPFMYSSEIFPQKYREVGMSLAVAINLSFAGALAMAVPLYQKTLTGSTSDSQPRDPNSSPKQNNEHLILLGSFAALDFVAVILVWVFMRYPKKFAELEEMNLVFGASTIDYIRYLVETTWNSIRRFEFGPNFENWQEDRLQSGNDNQDAIENHEMTEMSSSM